MSLKVTSTIIGLPTSAVGLVWMLKVMLGVKCAGGAIPLCGPVEGSVLGGGLVGVRDFGGLDDKVGDGGVTALPF